MFDKGYPQDKLITYSGMLWLLAAQIVVMLPLLFHLPIWLLPILIFSAGWRIRVMQGKLEQPGLAIKIILGILGLLALKLSGLPLVSLEMTASFLMLGFAYKSLEVIHRRDGMVVVLTGFMLVGVLFLYSQTILITLYSFLSVTVLTGAMIAIQRSGNQSASLNLRSAISANLRLASGMLALCLPLMLLFFLFAPRLPPFWTVPSAGGQAKTGVSDSMSPGDIAKLSQSDELAFTVSFMRERPKQIDLYWRGLVLQHFDGTTWTQNDPDIPPRLLGSPLRTKTGYPQLFTEALSQKLNKQGEAVDYSVIYQKSGQPWMFALNPVVDLQGDAVYASNFRIRALGDINEPVLVKLSSYPESLIEVELDPATRATNLQLPEEGNDKSRLLAEQLFATSDSKEEYIQRVLNRFREQQYFYTLRPPLLGEKNTIDGFLIDSKKGFCAHYSGSFVFLMRAVGIPARVVAGYQGGEWNEKGQFLAVHQFDAHAWTEVWLEGKGWQRYDPTAMVAPQRIEQNLEAAMQQEGSFLEGQILSMNKMKWLNGLRKQFDSLQFGWQRFVLNFDSETQQNFLQKLFGEMSIRKTMLIVGGFFIGIILLWVGFLGLAKKRNIEAPEHQLYRRFCERLAKQGIKRELAQTPEAFSLLASSQLPNFAETIKEFTRYYSTLCYNPSTGVESQIYLEKMKTLLRNL